MHCNTLQHTATHCNTLQHTSTSYQQRRKQCCWKCTLTCMKSSSHCNALQHTATHCNTLQHTTAHKDKLTVATETVLLEVYTDLQEKELTMQHTATHCTATHCNTLQHTRTSSRQRRRQCCWKCTRTCKKRKPQTFSLKSTKPNLYVAVCCSVLPSVAVW